jgi:hypothetical protein
MWEYFGELLHTKSVLRGRTADARRQLRGNILLNCSIHRVSFEDRQRMPDDSYVGIFCLTAPYADCPSRTDSACWTTTEYEACYLKFNGRRKKWRFSVYSTISKVVSAGEFNRKIGRRGMEGIGESV